MTYEEARNYIKEAEQLGSVPGLETISEMLNRLGNPHKELKLIHVAGTNGKGSSAAFLAAILTAAGYRVGRYLSPSVFSYREKIQVIKPESGPAVSGSNHDRSLITKDNPKSEETIYVEYISREDVCKAIDRIKKVCEDMVAEGHAHPTYFEIETAMAFLYLAGERVDYAIIETGMGGRLDATNIIRRPICSIITSVSMDHMQFLGDTLEKIADHKAGIIKMGAPVITCEQPSEVTAVIIKKAKEMGSPLTIADSRRAAGIRYSLEGTFFTYPGEDGPEDFSISLLGEYQVKNAVLALEAARVIGQADKRISMEAIIKGLRLAGWAGRFELIGRKPDFIIDGAHNEDAALTLRRSIEIYFTNRRIIFMIGVLADKDYKSILKITAPLADTIITLTPDSGRALSSAELAKEAKEFCNRVLDAGNVKRAIETAYTEAGADDVIIAFGSLSFLGSLADALQIRKDVDEPWMKQR